MSLPSQTERTESWPPDIRIMAKYMMVFGVLMYVQWAIQTYVRFDGIFEIDGGYPVGGDFINYWSAAKLALNHSIMTLFDMQSYNRAEDILFNHPIGHSFRVIYRFSNWSYPPSFIPMILWLGFFPYTVALVLWIAVTFVLYAFAVCYKRPNAWLLGLMLTLAPATYANFDYGQNGFLSAGLLLGGLRLMETRPTLAGILFGLLGFKPQLGLLVPFALLAAKKWKVFAVAILTGTALIGLSILCFGIEPWESYIKVVIPLQRSILEMPSERTFTRMMPTPFMAMRILGAGLPAAYAANAATALGAVLAVVYAFRRHSQSDLRNAALLTAAFLASPYLLFYDMPALNAALICTIAAMKPQVKPYVLILLLIVWFLPAYLFAIQVIIGFPVGPPIIGALLTLQLYMIRTQRAEGERLSSVSNPGDRDARH